MCFRNVLYTLICCEHLSVRPLRKPLYVYGSECGIGRSVATFLFQLAIANIRERTLYIVLKTHTQRRHCVLHLCTRLFLHNYHNNYAYNI